MNELIKNEKNALSIFNNTNVSNILKPLQQEIFLVDLFLYNVDEKCSTNVISKLKTNDEIILRHNKKSYDKFMVIAYTKDNVEIGSINEQDNRIFANLLDAGKILKCKIKKVGIMPQNKFIEISIYLVDF